MPGNYDIIIRLKVDMDFIRIFAVFHIGVWRGVYTVVGDRSGMEASMRIAVCDDEKATREHIVSLIKEQDANADLTVFADGEEMLKSDGDFDISFLDMGMREKEI